MSGDPRGFDYGLEPVRRRRQWLLDAAQARLGSIESALAEARAERDRLMAEKEAAQQEAARALLGAFDPARHRRALAWLAWQRSEIERIKRRIDALESDRDAARREVLAMQLQCDLIETHRDECKDEFVRDALRREATEVDRDWLMRRAAASAFGETDQIEVLP